MREGFWNIRPLYGILPVVVAVGLFPVSIAWAGLVPCGQPGNPCTVCHIFQLIDNIFDFFVVLSFPLAGLMIAWGAVLILSSGGAEARVRSGKDAIKAAVIGVAIVLLAWLIVDTIIVNLALGGGFLFPWNNIPCP